jgi:tetratricopeptide (TPR) repeat protein
MESNKSSQTLYDLAWEHIREKRFDQAEPLLRTVIDGVDPGDSERLWSMFGLLASVLNSLSRFAEGTEMYRRQLAEARKGVDKTAVEVARYMLANQFLIHGDPAEALAETQPIPAGCGHVQCLLHSVAAQALWKLHRPEESRAAALNAITSSPTDERRLEMTETLGHIVKAG